MINKERNAFDIFSNRTPLRGRCLIEASAGTGKTYNISGLFVRLAAENVLGTAGDPSKIVVVTYTRAATKELRERITRRLHKARELLDPHSAVRSTKDNFLKKLKVQYEEGGAEFENLKKAVANIDDLSVYTIHGFAHRLLQEFGPSANIDYTGEIIVNAEEVTAELIYDYWRSLLAQAEENLNSRMLLKILREECSTPDEFIRSYSDYLSDSEMSFEYAENEEKVNGLFMDIQENFRELQDEFTTELSDEFWILYNKNEEKDLQLYAQNFKPGKWQEIEEVLSLIPRVDYALGASIKEWEKLSDLAYLIDGEKIKKSGSFDELPMSTAAREWLRKLKTFIDSVRELDRSKGGIIGYVLKKLNDAYFDALDERDKYTYDDLLCMADRMVDEYPDVSKEIRDRYPVSLIDEFQDTDPLQWSMFDNLYENSAADNTLLCLIGDPKQSIYRFRGADINAYLRAREAIPEKNRFTLDVNHRSNEYFIKALNRLWGKQSHAFFTGEIQYKKVKHAEANRGGSSIDDWLGALQWVIDDVEEAALNKNEARERAAEITAKHIRRTLREADERSGNNGEDKFTAGDIAVLCKSNREADLMKEMLFKYGLNSVQLSRDSVFKSREARELQIVIGAVADPANAAKMRTALGTQMLNGSDILVGVSRSGASSENYEDRWEWWLTRFHEWYQRWNEDGFTAMMRRLMEQGECIANLMRYHDGERRVTNLRHLTDLLQETARERPGEIQYLLYELQRYRQQAGEHITPEEQELRLENDRDLINIITIHRSKGLEFPIVYTPFLWNGINVSSIKKRLPYEFHDPNDPTKKCLDIDENQIPNSRYYYFKEEFEDQLRLAYVAMTRAVHHNIIITVPYKHNYAPSGNSAYSAIDYVLFGPERYSKALNKKFDNMMEADGTEWITYKEVKDKVKSLAQGEEDADRVIKRELWSDESELKELGKAEDEDANDYLLQLRPFELKDRLRQEWMIYSYSALRRGLDPSDFTIETYDAKMDDESDMGPDLRDEESPGEFSMLTFPKGARTGLCWHRIYEEITFGDPESYEPTVKQELEAHGFNSGEWSEVVRDHVETTLHNPLPQAGGLMLAGLESERVNKEMEFHFRYEQAELADILSIIRDRPASSEVRGIPKGLMQGFIDLTFEHEGKVYLADYKSNHLGMELDDYRQESLEQAIHEHYYDLQYHLYTVALHRYLKQRIGDSYKYNSHFGGAFYLFLRGIRGGASTGIFFDRPDREVIEELDEYFKAARTYA